MARTKLGARLVRASLYSIILSAVLGLLGYLSALAINTMSGQTVINQIGFLLFFAAVGFGAPLAIEVSKDIEQDESS